MACLKPEQLQEGMVLARDVRNVDGMLLVAAQTRLTERQIGILQSWGVHEIEVEGGEAGGGGNPLDRLPPAARAQLAETLRARYWNRNAFSNLENEIFQVMLLRQAQRLASGTLNPPSAA